MEEKHFGPIWVLSTENRGRYPDCNSIFIQGPDILIDPAAEKSRLEEICRDEGVSEVWLSHAHEDHLKNLYLFGDRPLAADEKDALAVTDIELFLDSYGVAGETRKYWRDYVLDKFNFRPREVSRILQPGEVIDLGSVTVDVIGTPGHTPGHLAFFFREPEVLFLADYDLTKFGPWYGDLRSSISDTVASIDKLRNWPAKVWITSHERGILDEPPGQLWDDYLHVITVREEKLLDLLSEPRSFEEIIRACIVYWEPRKPEGFFDLGERGHMIKHLDKLMNEGRVLREKDKFVRL